ncbi:hypothetical protein DOTSEDRAFT_44816 [Dothistroma septosporum NZE10]|uniref:Uncharacterized protein n=1 Tax=Dothistroma septosporum (strain NZE10 / CBS 128990) TaxID=675120 RepID=N1PMP6_DOTSN|nr:hypothetical protein DOTSEDRAFT_44816 [Dothistroma septosporum NZE10]
MFDVGLELDLKCSRHHHITLRRTQDVITPAQRKPDISPVARHWSSRDCGCRCQDLPDST